MIDELIKIAGTGTANATTNAVASVAIPFDGMLIGVGVAVATNAAAVVDAELSFASTNQIGNNGARQAIFSTRVAPITAIGPSSQRSDINFPDAIEVQTGEDIFLHTVSDTVGATVQVEAILYFRRRSGGRSRVSTRRR